MNDGNRVNNAPEGGDNRKPDKRRTSPGCRKKKPRHDEPICKVEELEKPIQSPLDEKQYKIIRLSNGLRAILISDLTPRKGGKILHNCNCIDARVEQFNQQVVGIPAKPNHCCTGAHSGEIGNADGYVWVKHDESHVKATSDILAAASFSVGVGGIHDFKRYHGLAHFTEHLIFFGSREYPHYASIDKFLAENKGNANGTTFNESTNLRFDMHKSKFATGVRMLSNHIADPIMPLGRVITERNNVDSEFRSKLQHELRRRTAVLKTTAKKGHPIGFFISGNNETLGKSEVVNREVKDLREAVVEFHRAYYKAGIITLAVQASLSLDELEKLVVENCSQIPSGIPEYVSKFKDKFEPNPFDTPEFRKLYKIVPIHNIHILWITWELPPEAATNYQVAPFAYLTRLLESEREGGLVHFLKKWNLISRMIRAKINENLSSQFSSLFEIGLRLTDTGIHAYADVLEHVFTYLKWIELHGIDANYFHEMQTLNALNFHFEETLDVQDYTKNLSAKLAYCPPRDVLIATEFPMKWNPDLIVTYLRELIPSKANFTVISKNFVKECTAVEETYNVKYCSVEDNSELVKRLEAAQINREIPKLEANDFITNSFCKVEQTKEDVPEKSRLIYEDKRVSIEHEMRYDFGGKSEIKILFLSSTTNSSGLRVAMLQVWIQMIVSSLYKQIHAAKEAGLKCDISLAYQSLRISLSGYANNLPRLHNILLGKMNCMKNLLPLHADEFYAAKTCYLDLWHNLCTTTCGLLPLAKDISRNLFLQTSWLFYELQAQLESLKFEQFKKFLEEYHKNLFGEVAVVGNFTTSTAKRIGCDMAKILNYEPAAIETKRTILVNKLPLGETILRIKNMNPDDETSIIMNIFQLGLFNNKMNCFGTVIAWMLNQPFFQKLRTQEGIGYTIEVNYNKIEGRLMVIEIMIMFSSKKFRASDINRKMNCLIKSFMDSVLQKMRKAEFDTYLKKVLTVDDVSSKNNLTLSEARRLYEKYFYELEGSEKRMVSIQIVGKYDTEYSVSFEESPQGNHGHRIGDKKASKQEKGKICPLPLTVVVPPPKSQASGIRYVKSIYEFKRSLQHYTAKWPPDDSSADSD